MKSNLLRHIPGSFLSLDIQINKMGASYSVVNSYSAAKLIYLNFQPLEVVSRCRDPQPQVVENDSYLFDL